MNKKILLFLALILFPFIAKAQQAVKVSVYAEVSIITVGPGQNLYDAFGHSAVRFKDPLLRMDWVFNYGIFDFNAPNFYSNFAKGRLLYKLGVQRYEGFLENYKQQRRWVKEQVLDLTHDEKQAFFEFLYENAKPKNAAYYYDPFFDNCATKLRDITNKVLKEKVHLDTSYVSQGLSLRQLMNKELPWNTWGSFGINLALGSKLDKKVTGGGYMYLPDYIHTSFKGATKTNTKDNKLIKKEEDLYKNAELEYKSSWLSPMLIISLLSFIGLFFTYKDIKNLTRNRFIDFLLFFISGLIGCLLVFLWFYTDHKTTPDNFNVLWAFAPNLFLAFTLLKKELKKWVSYYLKLLILLVLLLVGIWVLGIQLFNWAIIPILLLFLVRFYYLDKALLTFKE